MVASTVPGQEAGRPTSSAPRVGEDGGVWRRRVLVALVAVQLLLLATGIVYWRLQPGTPAAPPLPPPDPSAAQPATLESGLADAQAQADRWLPGATLTSATMQVDWPWDPPASVPAGIPGTGWIDYVFVAPWQAPGLAAEAATLSLLVERLSGQVVVQSTASWQTPPAPAPFAAPPVSSAAATLAAEAAGGTEFRRACPSNRHLSRTSLVAAGDAWPRHWIVTYEDVRQPIRHGFLVRIDAATGALLETQRDAKPCGAERDEPSG